MSNKFRMKKKRIDRELHVAHVIELSIERTCSPLQLPDETAAQASKHWDQLSLCMDVAIE